jgi:decaprenyl-phosphate phosphoribosyltransferase
MIKAKTYLQLIRLNNIKKSIIVFFPYIFSGYFLDFEIALFLKIIIGALVFYLFSALVYIFNDYFDKAEDSKHPIKKSRPIASGLVNLNEVIAIVTFLILIIFLLFIQYDFLNNIIYLFLAYIINNVLYNLLLKKLNPYLASLSISFGFLLRAYVGLEIIDVDLEQWLPIFIVISTFLVSVLKKYTDGYILNKSIFNFTIYSLFGLLSLVYFFHQIELTNNEVTLYVVINFLLFLLSLIIVHNFFLNSDSPKDPVSLFNLNSASIIFVLWLITYIEIRYGVFGW